MNTNDKFGFRFWLGWIFWCAASFVLSAMGWTFLMSRLFGKIQGPELTFSWAVSVFGSWFLLLTPFMRKKEQIWKRLNDDQERSINAWLQGLGLFLLLLVASTIFASFLFRDAIHSQAGFDRNWLKTVFGSWLALILPFLIWMYRKADAIFKTAIIRQTNTTQNPFRSLMIARAKRLLPEPLSRKLHGVPPTIQTGHVVTAVLKDGRRIPHCFVINSKELLGIYDRVAVDFEGSDIIDILPTPTAEIPPYEEAKWLRLNGKV